MDLNAKVYFAVSSFGLMLHQIFHKFLSESIAHI